MTDTAHQLIEPILFDRSHWGRIRLTGADRVRFLHNQTTNNIEQLSVGQGCYSVFVTSTGRTIDLATVYVLPEVLLVVVSPGLAQQLYEWMDRYIFFSDKVTLSDESAQTFMFTVVGEGADDVINSLGGGDLIGQADFRHQTLQLAQTDCLVAVGSDLAISGYTLIGPKEKAAAVQQALTETVAQLGSPEQWEQLRVQQGRPMPAQELTDGDNPLEAGLWHSISFEKGCYIGQETIARLNTYKGVKKRLWGFKLDQAVAPGATIFSAEAKVGKLTSAVETATGVLGLGYLRTKAGGEGLQVIVEGADGEGVAGEVIALPFISHDYYTADNAAASP